MLEIGQFIAGRYQIKELFDKGAMGSVYRAIDTKHNRAAAVKILKKEGASDRFDDIVRFQREIEIVSKLSHPNLVEVYDAGEYSGWHYIAMEFLKGATLKKHLSEGRAFQLDEVIHIVSQLAVALDHVHSVSVVHRDLKPGNIFLVNEGPDSSVIGTVKILDFGLAQIVRLPGICGPEAIAGTFGYMSPEHTGIVRQPVDKRADLYSVGIIFYQLLTGKLPFSGDTVSEILHQQIAKQPTLPSKINPLVPCVPEQIVMKLLRKDPAERYQSAAGLVADLQKFAKHGGSFVVGKYDRTDKLNYITGLIGREEEYNQMKGLYHQASAGRGSICLISGEAGSGKSRLAEEMRRYAYEAGGEFIWGKCSLQGSNTPYQPFREAINEFLHEINKLTVIEKESRINRLKATLGGLAEVVCYINPALKTLLGDIPPLVPLDSEKEKTRFLMVCAKFFQHFGRKGKPVIIMIDDLHWADEGTLTLIEEILEGIARYPLLLIGTFRDNEIPETHSLNRIIKAAKEKKFALVEIKIQNFDLNRTNKFVAKILFEEDVDVFDLSEFVYKKGQGNPFFTIEIIRQLVANRALVLDKGKFVPQWEQIKRLAIPLTIVDIVLKRIESLSAQQTHLLTYGAIIGKEFDIDLLVYLTRLSGARVVALLDELVSLQLLEHVSEKNKVVFIHDRIRDAFYGKVGQSERKEMHLKIAGAIEEMNGDNPTEHEFDLAYHYTEAEVKDKSLEYSMLAAEKASSRFSHEEAMNHYEVAIGVLEETGRAGSPFWVKAKESLIEIYLAMGQNNETIKLCQELLPLKQSSFEKAVIYRFIGAAFFKKGDWQASEENLIQSLRLLGQGCPKDNIIKGLWLVKPISVRAIHYLLLFFNFAKEPAVIEPPVRKVTSIHAYKEIVQVFYYLLWMYSHVDVTKFLWISLVSLNDAQFKLGKSKELAMGLAGYGGILMSLTCFKHAKSQLSLAVDLSREIGYTPGTAHALQWLGLCYTWMGKGDNALEHLEQSAALFSGIGDLWGLAMTYNAMGHCYRVLSDYDKSISAYSRYQSLSQKIVDYYGISSAMAGQTYCYCEKGEFGIAGELGEQAVRITQERNIWSIDCYALANLGYLRLEQNNYREAIKLLEKARQSNESKNYLKEFTIYLYSFLAEAYIMSLADIETLSEKKSALKYIEQLCRKTRKEAKRWVNHFGAALRVNAKYYALVGRKKKAQDFFLKSIDHCRHFGRKFELAKSFYEYALFLKTRDQSDQAEGYLQQAYDLFRQIGAGEYIKRVSKLLEIPIAPGEEQETELQGITRVDLFEKLGMLSLREIGACLSSIEDSELVLEKIMDVSMELSGAKRGYLLLYTEAGVPVTKVSRHIDEETFNSQDFSVSRTVIKKVEDSREPLIVNDAGLVENLGEQISVVIHGLRSILCLPLIVKNKLVGTLYLDNRLVGGVFSEDKLELLRNFVLHAAMAIENAYLNRQLQELEIEGANLGKSSFFNTLKQFVSLYDLTSREKQVMQLLLERKTSSEIQERLSIKQNTLKTHLRNIYGKVMVNNRNELYSKFVEFSQK